MILCIVPARGGSRGIPRKNVTPVGGKPLIAWTLEHARESRYIDEVIVSTDCDEIAFTCGHYGVTIHHRSPETATDTAASELALREVLASRHHVELCVFLQATSPMRAAGDIDGAITLLRQRGLDSVFSGRRVEGYLWRTTSNPLVGLVPLHSKRVTRQYSDVDSYEENGSIYVFQPQVLDRYRCRLGGAIGVYPMHPLDGYQIDEPQDIPFIESLMRLRGYV
jgi:N-acylneuraminate cytidylyltransferase